MSNKTAPLVDAQGVRADAALIPPDVPDFDDAPSLPVVDRSTLERYAACPAMGRLVELGRVLTASIAADVGSEVHEAFSAATDEYVQSNGVFRAAELADVVRGRLLLSRPNIQPLVLDAAAHCAYPWSKFLDQMPPPNVLRYDGGKGSRSGQLAWDIDGVCRLTSELDFLHAGPSKGVLHEIDWKSGFSSYSVKTIHQSFQFQTHAWLVFQNYPVDELEVRIWRTRNNDLSQPVTFSRKDDFQAIDYRIGNAARIWAQHRNALPETCVAHPTVEGCETCPAKHLCTVVPRDEVDADPADYLRRLWAMDCKVRAMESALRAYVERTGEDVTTPDGMAFGFDKPKPERKATATLYTTK